MTRYYTQGALARGRSVDTGVRDVTGARRHVGRMIWLCLASTGLPGGFRRRSFQRVRSPRWPTAACSSFPGRRTGGRGAWKVKSGNEWPRTWRQWRSRQFCYPPIASTMGLFGMPGGRNCHGLDDQRGWGKKRARDADPTRGGRDVPSLADWPLDKTARR